MNLSGLSQTEVDQRVAAGQTNRTTTESSRSLGAIVRSNVVTRVNVVLGTLFVLVLVVAAPQDALFGGVLVANTLIGIVQEIRVKRALDRLRLVASPLVTVRREGGDLEISPHDVVLDDLVALRRGDQVVADGEMVEAEGLEIDESLLTGESDPQPKSPGDRVTSGSAVVAGTGWYRAGPVGAASFAQRLAADARRFEVVHSELRTGINRLLTWIAWALVPASVILIIGQTRTGLPWRDAATGAIAGIVMMVPEGLVLLTSAAFAVSGIRLARRQALIQELPAVEVLARVDVLCIDKTGTLTEGAISLKGVTTLRDDLDVATALAALGSLPEPNASQAAIAAHYPDDPAWHATTVVPFSSARRWSAAAFDTQGSYVLGAPEVVLHDHEHDARNQAIELAATGARVIALAHSASPLDATTLPADRTAAALIALDEQLRDDAHETLAFFARQGVVVKVLSGDNPHTVGTIAARVGLDGRAIDARELPVEPAELDTTVAETTVFGRVEPHQKLAIVTSLQRQGHVVAMTGDGVNDMLALKQADLGIAMGAGAPAVRAVAQLVLVDNRFSSLPRVVAEGRRVLANIEKLALLFLSKTGYAIVLALVIGLTARPYPFLPRHLTLASSITIGVPSFVLAFAPNDRRYLPGFVPRVMRRAAPYGLTIAVAVLAVFEIAYRSTTLDRTRTISVIALLAGGFAVLIATSRPLSRWRVALVGSMVALGVLAFAVPFARDFYALAF